MPLSLSLLIRTLLPLHVLCPPVIWLGVMRRPLCLLRARQIATQAVAAAAPSPTEQLASTQALERLREQVEGSLPV
eukprot:SAG11_NODE_638_length_8025_cov_14.591093_2_plen_76_part_00